MKLTLKNGKIMKTLALILVSVMLLGIMPPSALADYDVWVEFEDWDGTEIDTKAVSYGSNSVTPPTIDAGHRPGYNFIGWLPELWGWWYEISQGIIPVGASIPIDFNEPGSSMRWRAMYAPLDGMDFEIVIPDGSFLHYIRMALGRPEDDNNPVMYSEVLNMTQLIIWNHPGEVVNDMTGIEHFKSLYSLTIWPGNLVTLDISGNIALEYVYVSGNRLTGLDVRNNARLRSLHCDSNRLTTLDLSGNPDLGDLFVNNNRLTGLDLTANPYINTLRVHHNLMPNNEQGVIDSITAYHALEHPNYGEFTLLPQNIWPTSDADITNDFTDQGFRSAVRAILGKSATQPIMKSDVFDIAILNVSIGHQLQGSIKSLAGIEHFIGLESLDCRYNQIEGLDLGANTRLRYLFADGNQLKSLNIKNNHSLVSLSIWSNLLTELELSPTAPFESIDVTQNRFENTSAITGQVIAWDAAVGEYQNYIPFLFSPQSEPDSFIITFEDWDGAILKEVKLHAGDRFPIPAPPNPTRSGFNFIGWDVGFDALEEMFFEWLGNQEDSGYTTGTTVVAKYSPVTDSPINIPDPNFLAAIRNYLEIPTRPILLSDVVNVTMLEVEGWHITSLEGIGYFTSLRDLYCRFNKLTTLDLSKNVALGYLNASYNRLAALTFPINGRVNTIILSHNRLTGLDLRGNCRNLSYLDVSYNLLTGLDLSGISYSPYAVQLKCQRNNMASEGSILGFEHIPVNYRAFHPQNAAFTGTNAPIDIPDPNFRAEIEDFLGKTAGAPILRSEVFNIGYLYIPNTGIADLTGIEFFIHLELLNCGENQLTELDLSANVWLTELNCGSNQLTELNVGSNTALENLYVYNNNLSGLDVSNNQNLVYFYCTYNRLTSLTLGIHENLHMIDASYNRLTSLDLSGSSGLNYLHVSHNLFTGIRLHPTAPYEGIDLRMNRIPSTSAILGRSGLDWDIEVTGSCCCGPWAWTPFTFSPQHLPEFITGIIEDTDLTDPYSVHAAVEAIKEMAAGSVAGKKSDPEVYKSIKALEEAHKGFNGISVNPVIDASMSAALGFSGSAVFVTGAGLNVTGNAEVTMRISAASARPANPRYEKVIPFSMTLLGGGINPNRLNVPVTITMPIPDGFAYNSFRILHFHTGSSTYDLITPQIIVIEGITHARFTLTRFSEFAFVELAPASPPSEPENLRANFSDRAIRLSWTAPENDGGAPISHYEVSVNGGAWTRASSNTGHNFPGLTVGATYTFRVRAVNSAGAGAIATISTRMYDLVEQFVSRQYLDVLGRGYDSGGLQFWADWLRSGEMTGAAAAYESVFSGEFINRSLSDADYVETLYVAFMGRGSDSGGKAYWVDLLEAGLPRVDVFAGFANSAEFEHLCNVAGIRRGMHHPPPGGYAQMFIKRMYLTTLERDADHEGVIFWQGLAVDGMTGAAMAYEFVFSGEMERRSLSNAEYIEILYNSMMGRVSDPEGMAFWLDMMERQGVSRYAVFANFVMSGEFEVICSRHGLLRGTPP